MTKTTSKPTVLFVAMLVISAFILTGCQSSNSQDDSLNPGVVTFDMDEKIGSNPDSTDSATSTSTRSAIRPSTSLKGTMKQLSDFETIKATQATLTTTKGDITFELYREQAPITTANFLNLAKSGFYDGIVFHRIIADFMAQVGDPLTKDPGKEAMWGTGGPGYSIPDEFGAGLSHDSEGIVSMANSGPNSGGSQIFITYAPTQYLDGKHAIFGKVTKGMDVLRNLEIGDKIVSVKYQ